MKDYTEHEFNIESEKRKQKIRSLEIQKLDRQISIKTNEVRALDFDVKKSAVTVDIHDVTYQNESVKLSVSRQQLGMTQDGLKTLEASRILTQDSMAIDLQSQLTSLSEKKQLLANSQESLKLKLGNLTQIKMLE
jgi:hypothetical protein